MHILRWALLLSFSIGLSPANATDSLCEAIATRSTEKTEDFGALKLGQKIDAITQYNINKGTGKASLCFHGGGCYPADALRLTNCTVNYGKPAYEDASELTYGLNPIRSKISPAILRQNDVELKLLNLGMCSACADNAAAFYVKMPNSRCAKLVGRALEGEPDATSVLKDMPSYCSE